MGKTNKTVGVSATGVTFRDQLRDTWPEETTAALGPGRVGEVIQAGAALKRSDEDHDAFTYFSNKEGFENGKT